MARTGPRNTTAKAAPDLVDGVSLLHANPDSAHSEAATLQMECRTSHSCGRGPSRRHAHGHGVSLRIPPDPSAFTSVRTNEHQEDRNGKAVGIAVHVAWSRLHHRHVTSTAWPRTFSTLLNGITSLTPMAFWPNGTFGDACSASSPSSRPTGSSQLRPTSPRHKSPLHRTEILRGFSYWA